MKYIQPQVFLNSFTCPHCGAIAKQDWWMKRWSVDQPNGNKDIHPLRVGTCHHCQKTTLWVDDKMYFPDTGNAPFPNPEMPESVLKLYVEAAAISSKSPRGNESTTNRPALSGTIKRSKPAIRISDGPCPGATVP